MTKEAVQKKEAAVDGFQFLIKNLKEHGYTDNELRSAILSLPLMNTIQTQHWKFKYIKIGSADLFEPVDKWTREMFKTVIPSGMRRRAFTLSQIISLKKLGINLVLQDLPATLKEIF